MFPALTKIVRGLGQGTVQLFFPNICWVCHGSLAAGGRWICPKCRLALTDDPNVTCPRCSSTVGPHSQSIDGCPACREQSLAFDRAFRLGPYDGLLRDVVLRMKNSGGEGLADVVGRIWADHLRRQLETEIVNVIVPVPLHWWRRLQRGFNQAETLARAAGDCLNVPCRPRWLKRIRYTRQQPGLLPSARRLNVQGAFLARRGADLLRKRVLLIDDVLTTGATAHEAAKALRRAGADTVIVAILAHGHSR